MSRWILILSVFFMVISLQAKPKILATASMWYDMASVIGADMIEVDLIVPIGSDPHLYEPTPNDVRKVQSADLILVNGLTFEGWLQKLISSSGTKAITKIITEGILPIHNESFKNATDPHAWMDPLNGIMYAENITRALQQLDPIHSREYQFNLDIYKQQLTDLHHFIMDTISKIPHGQRILITSHDAFHYFGNRYGLKVESLLGVSTDADIQTGDFIRINQLIKDRDIPAVFIESTINPKMMYQLSKENNIMIGGKLYADSLGDEASPASSYIGMLRHNACVIAEALCKKKQFTTTNPTGEKNTNRMIFLIPIGMLIILLIFILIKRYV
jgi:ABC-type Zn uptake system ZnuABC Zn-binding protein ZnuA